MEKSQKLTALSGVNHGFCNRFDSSEQYNVISFVRQIHSFEVLDPSLTKAEDLIGDALVTTQRGLKIAVRTADCAPVLLSDGKVIAAVHAGWKGAVTGIVETALLSMIQKGADLLKVVAAVGPCIHVDSYPKSDLTNILSENLECFWVEYPDGQKHFDLPQYVMYRLQRAGVQNVDLIDIDTYEDEDYNSFRRAPDDLGRQYSWIELK